MKNELLGAMYAVALKGDYEVPCQHYECPVRAKPPLPK